MKGKFYKVTEKEPIYYETGRTDTAEFSAVTSGSNSGYKNITVLEPDTDHLYGITFGIRDGCRYYVKVPTGRDRLGLDEDMDVGFVIAEMSPWIDPDPAYGMWLVEDMYPAIDAYNDSPLSVTPKVHFGGSKYTYERVTDTMVLSRLEGHEKGLGGQVFTVVILGGVEG